MWYMWTALLVSCAVVAAEAEAEVRAGAQATTRAPHRTLDRQAAELAWRSWLQSPESGNQNAPPRRITTKSLFITPLVCPKGQRLDSNGCVQVVTVNQDEHERILLEQLNALFTSPPSGDVVYDYGDEEPGPLQLSIPIGNMEPQAAPLQAQEPSAQAQEQQPSYVKVDKKDETKPDPAAGLVAELELLQLQHSQNSHNETASAEAIDILNHNVLQALDKPKRDSPDTNSTEISSESYEGQKEQVYGHVNVDPVLYDTDIQTEQPTTTEGDTEAPTKMTAIEINDKLGNIDVSNSTSTENQLDNSNTVLIATNGTKNVNSTNILKKDGDQMKLNPENDYADIGEAIKLISRYAEVTTDDSFSKDQKKYAAKDDSILGTRTKLQYRRNKPKPAETPQEPLPVLTPLIYVKEKKPIEDDDMSYPKEDLYYRYPWQGQHSPTPPPNYPFRHIQDYWPGRNQVGGVYNTAHENPRRHHHTFPHSYYRPHSLQYASFPGPHPVVQNSYAGPLQPSARRMAPPPHHARPMRSHTTNQDLYTLLGLRHWFSSEGTSKR
ncbi:uncharacterized protein LOC126368655 isoform X2 [Pectinophora gossypiella]|nr:uncharacterized protein LOC126368655 isoform X2 [Pectinophora gossypiella]